MTDTPSPRPSRSALSPAARALRLQRIFARLQDGASYADIAAEESFSRERLRQIIRAATAPGRGWNGPDHKRMQIARLTPALRLAADGVALIHTDSRNGADPQGHTAVGAWRPLRTHAPSCPAARCGGNGARRRREWGGGKAGAPKNLEKHRLGVWRLANL